MTELQELPFGSSISSYSLSSTHLAFVSVPPSLSPAFHTRTNIYVIPLFSSPAQSPPRSLSSGTQGLSSSPTFSPTGTHLAWLEQLEDGYEADRNRLVVYSIRTGETRNLTENWDRSPIAIEWSIEGDKLYVTADEEGHVKLFEIALQEERGIRRLTRNHSVSSICSLGNDRLLLSISSFTHPIELYTLDTYNLSTPSLTSSFTRSLLAHKNLSKGQEFWFTSQSSNSTKKKVQGWILFPPSHPHSHSTTCSNSKEEVVQASSYPLAFCCTGGPQHRVADEWSDRWNLNLYASKGYITVIINRTGSTG